MKELANKLIRERRSTQPLNFDPNRKIDDALISEMLETAVWAPSHGLTQPWSFRVFHGTGIADFYHALMNIYTATTPVENFKPAKLTKYEENISLVSHVIAICMNRDPKRRFPEIEEIVAASCVIENLYICIQAYGIAGYLSTGDICYTKEVKEFLGLGEEDRCLGFFLLGYAKEGITRPERKRIPASEKTTWIGS